MSKFLSAVAVSTVAVIGLALATDATAQTKFYDQSGGFRGYAWCKKRGMDIVNCDYYTLGQCQASGSGFGPAYCVRNPFTPGGSGRRKNQATY